MLARSFFTCLLVFLGLLRRKRGAIKHWISNTLAGAAFCLALAGSAEAQTVDYATTDGNWSDVTQWYQMPTVEVQLKDEFGDPMVDPHGRPFTEWRDYLPGTAISRVPSVADRTLIRQGATVTVQSGTNATAKNVLVGDNPLYPGLADALDGNFFNDSWQLSTLPSHLIVKGGGAVTADHSLGVCDGSATIDAGGSVSAEAVGVTAGGHIIVNGSITTTHVNHPLNVQGGSLTINDGALLDLATTLQVYRQGSVIQVGGMVEVDVGGLNIEENSTYTIAGGTMSLPYIRVNSAKLELIGAGAASLQCGEYRQDNEGILAATIDTSGLSTIEVDGNVFFGSGALLNVEALAGAAPGEYVLMTWTGSLPASDLAFDPQVDTNTWGFMLDAQAKTLTLSYVPEPTSLWLAAIAGLVLMRRRRR